MPVNNEVKDGKKGGGKKSKIRKIAKEPRNKC